MLTSAHTHTDGTHQELPSTCSDSSGAPTGDEHPQLRFFRWAGPSWVCVVHLSPLGVMASIIEVHQLLPLLFIGRPPTCESFLLHGLTSSTLWEERAVCEVAKQFDSFPLCSGVFAHRNMSEDWNSHWITEAQKCEWDRGPWGCRRLYQQSSGY